MFMESISNQLLYLTMKIETKTGSGTGFFMTFFEGDILVPVIITNKHVVNHNPKESVQLSLHFDKNDKRFTEKITINGEWLFHSKYDLCCLLVNPIIEEMEEKHKAQLFCRSIDESMIYSDEKLDELNAMEDVTMVGYPIGLWDEVHNFPILRRGITATHPGIDYNGDRIAMVDMACFPGSSGSPIFIVNENGFSDGRGNLALGQRRMIFLGVLYAGPVHNTEGDIIIKDIPTAQIPVAQTRIMANLGYYVKASEIYEFKNVIMQKLKDEGVLK